MKSETLSVAVGVIGMAGGIALVILGSVNADAALTSIGSGLLSFILGAVFGQNASNLVNAVKKLWVKARAIWWI